MWRLAVVALCVTLVAAACTGSEVSDQSSSTMGPEPEPESDWVLEVAEGDPIQINGETFWDAGIAVSSEGVLVVAAPDGAHDRLIKTWMRGPNGEWVEGQITPQGGFDEFEPWIFTPAPEGFLLAGIGQKEGKGKRNVTSIIGNGSDWASVEDQSTGLSSILPEVMEHRCLCGWIRSFVPFADGYVAVGRGMDRQSKIWWSTDGDSWESSSFGRSDYWGMVGVVVLDDAAFTFGASPGPKVWRSENGQDWEVIAEGPAFDIAPNLDRRMSLFGMTVDDDRLYALMGVEPPFREDQCSPLLGECREQTLLLYVSEDGSAWEQVALPESVRWLDRQATIAAYDGRVFIAKTVDDQLQVWSTDDPMAVVVPPPDEQTGPNPEPFVAVRFDYERYVGDTRFDFAPWAMRSDELETLELELTARHDTRAIYVEAATSYLAENGRLQPETDPSVVEIRENQPLTFSVDVANLPLGAGLHEFELPIPFWLVKGGAPTGDPDGIVRLTVAYNVFDAPRIAEVKGFCDPAVLFAGRAETTEQLDRFDQLATEYLDGEIRENALAASEDLRKDIATGDYGTGGVVAATGDACGPYDLESMVVNTD